jgi:hypothetical protein
LIDHLQGGPASTLAVIQARCRGDDPGLRLLLDLLESGRVVERIGDNFRLPQRFQDALLPMLLFFRAFRSPTFYATRFKSLGLTRIEVQTLRLDMPFFPTRQSRNQIG